MVYLDGPYRCSILFFTIGFFGPPPLCFCRPIVGSSTWVVGFQVLLPALCMGRLVSCIHSCANVRCNGPFWLKAKMSISF